MMKIQDTVRDILYSDEEALFALAKGYMNLSAYAKQVKKKVEDITMKKVEFASIVVSLSRIRKELRNIHPLVQDIKINNITTKSPLSELVFEKNKLILSKLTSLYRKVKTTADDFLTMILSTNEITVICSDRIKGRILEELGTKPLMIRSKLASIGISFDQKYYDKPNITYSLIRRIARKKIVLAETITTNTEIIFVFQQRDLSEIIKLFDVN